MPVERGAIYAWMTMTADGTESIVGAFIPSGPGGAAVHTPLVSCNQNLIKNLKPIAKAHGQKTGQQVWLREFIAYTDHVLDDD